MKSFKTLLFLLLTSAHTLLAQETGTVTGVVADSVTQEPLLGVSVVTEKGMTSTDYLNGNYTLTLPVGSHELRFSYLGYATQKQTVSIKKGETTVLNVSLGEEATILNTATVTTSKFAKSLGEVTVSLDVIAPSLIENTNANAVNQVLDKVPGVTTMGDQVTIRGGAGFAQGTGSRVLILMDDLPVMQADAGLPNWADLPTENIAQMEVLKGAASALYGSTALNGVINIRTAYPLSKPITKLSLFGTLYDTPYDPKNQWWDGSNMPYETGLQFAHRQKFGKFDLVAGSNLFLNQSFMRGYRELDNGEIDSLPGYSRRGRVTLNTRYRHSENLIFSLNTNINFGQQSVFLFHSRIDPNLGYYETDFDPAPRGQNFRMTIDPAMTYYTKSGSRHRLQFRYFYIDNNNEGDQSNESNTFFGEYQFQHKFEQLDGLELAAGLVGSTVLSNADVFSGARYAHTNFAAYLQLDKKLFDRLNLSFGVRYEVNTTAYPDSIFYDLTFNNVKLDEVRLELKDTTEHKPVFRVGASYQLGKGTFIRASWGQGYRFPTVLEKFIATSTGGISVVPNPDLVSETGWSAELGIKQGFKVGKWQGFLDVAGFWTEYNNMMEFQAARDINSRFFNLPIAFQVQNIGNTRITGADVSLMGEGSIGAVEIALIAGYTLLNPQYRNFEDSIVQTDIQEFSTTDENILKYRNRHTIKFDGQVTWRRQEAAFLPWLNDVSVGLTVQYLSFMEGIDKFLAGRDDPATNPQTANPYTKIHYFREKHPNGSFIMNARLAYQCTKWMKLSFLMNNVLNNEYAIQPGKLEAPRNFTFRADFNF